MLFGYSFLKLFHILSLYWHFFCHFGPQLFCHFMDNILFHHVVCAFLLHFEHLLHFCHIFFANSFVKLCHILSLLLVTFSHIWAYFELRFCIFFCICSNLSPFQQQYRTQISVIWIVSCRLGFHS